MRLGSFLNYRVLITKRQDMSQLQLTFDKTMSDKSCNQKIERKKIRQQNHLVKPLDKHDANTSMLETMQYIFDLYDIAQI